MKRARVSHSLLMLLLVAFASARAAADGPSLPPPRDVPYPGTVRLEVDATDLDHRVFRIRETLPVSGPGPLALYYPRWLPGNHSDTGPIDLIAGLQATTSDGRAVEWRRDAEKTYAFWLDVPAGATALVLEFEFLTPVSGNWPRQVMTPDLLGLQWEKALLYPAGFYATQVSYRPSLRLPAGWQYATALDAAARVGDVVDFAPVSLEKLADSPVFAGAHYRRIDLDTDTTAPVRLNVFADKPAELAATPAQIEAHRRVVQQALALFGGARHFAHYDFLLAISDHFSNIGLEHHQSSENGVDPGYFTDWEGTAPVRDLLAHEFFHSWNGKFRRPAGLLTPSFDVPVDPGMLWVYEGLTEYYGMVLATRGGLWSPDFMRDALAAYAAGLDVGRAGRAWRNLQDTTFQPVISYRGKQTFPSWQRGKDYYTEGALLWLEVDMTLRQLTHGRRSLDDFARAFFGVRDGDSAPLAYGFDDIVGGLQAVAANDWAALLHARLAGRDDHAPLGGLDRSGWRLVYAREPSAFSKAAAASASLDDFLFSLGISLAKDGKLEEVLWGSTAFKAGLAPGMLVIAVDGRAYSGEILREAVKNAAGDKTRRIELLLRKSDTYQTTTLDYHEGLKYPRLERIQNEPDLLSELQQPRAPARKAAR